MWELSWESLGLPHLPTVHLLRQECVGSIRATHIPQGYPVAPLRKGGRVTQSLPSLPSQSLPDSWERPETWTSLAVVWGPRRVAEHTPKEKGQPFEVLAWRIINSLRYLLQVSLTIFRSVTLRSPYASFTAAFSTWPSFFSSAFSCAFDSR